MRRTIPGALVCVITFLAVATAQAQTANVTDESEEARVGQRSQSSSTTFDPAVELAFERAMAHVGEQSAATFTAEHLLFALLDEDTTTDLLSSSHVDVPALRAELSAHLSTVERSVDDNAARQDPALQNALRRAVFKMYSSNQRVIRGADIVIAILVEDESPAARALQKYGLTVEVAESEAFERYLDFNRRESERFAALQAKAREQRKLSTPHTLTRNPSPSKKAAERANVGEFVLRIVSEDDETERVAFKAAISRNGFLDLYIEETPYEIEIVASTLVGLFEAVDAGGRLSVKLMSEVDGEWRSLDGFSGSAGAIFRDPHSPQQTSGYLRR